MCHSPRAQESSTNGEPKHGLCTSILIPSRPHWAQPATMPICSEKLLTYTALMPLSGSHLTDGTASNDHSFLSASPRHASNAAIDQILAPYVLSCIAPFEDKIEALSPVSAPDANIEFPEKKPQASSIKDLTKHLFLASELWKRERHVATSGSAFQNVTLAFRDLVTRKNFGTQPDHACNSKMVTFPGGVS